MGIYIYIIIGVIILAVVAVGLYFLLKKPTLEDVKKQIETLKDQTLKAKTCTDFQKCKIEDRKLQRNVNRIMANITKEQIDEITNARFDITSSIDSGIKEKCKEM